MLGDTIESEEDAELAYGPAMGSAKNSITKREGPTNAFL
jgi:hypothetical protein